MVMQNFEDILQVSYDLREGGDFWNSQEFQFLLFLNLKDKYL